ncbi:hypothetical protein IWW38_004511, partial [Coemansia aciculifera]
MTAAAADPMMPVEECSERIDRLLQLVQQTHREYTARQALGSPETPTTRFDMQSTGTVSTISLASSTHSDSGSSSQQTSKHSIRGGASAAQTTTATDVRTKLDRLRAKRHAPQPTQRAMAGDFFEDAYNLAMFQELSASVKDIEWDKRVYYYHLAQNDDAYRRNAEDVSVRDCRDECLGELRPGRGGMRREDVDAVGAWLDEPDDLADAAERSFDWSRDGFGFMEFR